MDKRTRGILNLRAGRTDWYSIKNLAGGTGAEVMIYDEIGFYGVTAQDFVSELAAISGPITLRLNSPGGEVFDGVTIYNALKRHGDVSVVIDGIAASIASVIAQAASPGKLVIAKHAQMMIHDGFTMLVGNAADMRDAAEKLDQQSDNIAGIYADRTGKPASFWRDQMKAESWFIGQQAVDAGLADRIVDAPVAESKWDLSLFSRAPATVSNAATRPYVSATDTRHPPMTGTHTHDHAAAGAGDNDDGIHAHEHTHSGDADHMGHDHSSDNGWVQRNGRWEFDPDGDGDDDSTPDGDTDNDYWSPDGRPLKAIPPRPATAHSHDCFSNVKKPHGDVPYADPGYLDEDGKQASTSGKEGVARYPIDAEHVEAAWSYISQEDNAAQYTADQLASIKSRIKAAMKKHGHEVAGDSRNAIDARLLQSVLASGLKGLRA